AGLLEQEEAVRAAEEYRDLGWDPSADAYDAACSITLCIPIVSKHAKLDETQRQVAVQFYGEQAIKMLKDAVAKGFKDAAHAKKDTDLDPLREREDFKALMEEMARKP